MEINRIFDFDRRPPVMGDLAEIKPHVVAVTISGETVWSWPSRNLRLVAAETEPAAPMRLRHLHEVWAVGLKGERLAQLLSECNPIILHLEGCQTADLDLIFEPLNNVRCLAIDWNTKVENVIFLRRLPELEVLSLVDLKRVRDLGPISQLKKLRSLQIAGGMWSTLSVASLEPLAELEALEELRCVSVRVRDGSLAPLGKLRRLKMLSLPCNVASTEEFARLAARMPNVSCAEFHPYVRYDGVIMPSGTDAVAALDEIGDDMVLVTGKGKPLLNARSDRERLLRYCASFEAARRASL
jgi:hypothetical protein